MKKIKITTKTLGRTAVLAINDSMLELKIEKTRRMRAIKTSNSASELLFSKRSFLNFTTMVRTN